MKNSKLIVSVVHLPTVYNRLSNIGVHVVHMEMIYTVFCGASYCLYLSHAISETLLEIVGATVTEVKDGTN